MSNNIPVADLSAAMLQSRPRDIDWRAVGGEDGEGATFWQAFSYEYEGTDYTLVACNGSVAAVFLPSGVRVNAYEYEDYATEDHDGDPAMSLDAFNHLTEVEPYEYGADGPMMSYWYPLDGDSETDIGRYGDTMDAVAAAYRLRGEALCVVSVPDGAGDSSVGLALTGGGMDMTWDIVSAFVALGYLPPTHFCEPPGFDDDNMLYLLNAMHRALTFRAATLTETANRLAARYPDALA